MQVEIECRVKLNLCLNACLSIESIEFLAFYTFISVAEPSDDDEQMHRAANALQQRIVLSQQAGVYIPEDVVELINKFLCQEVITATEYEIISLSLPAEEDLDDQPKDGSVDMVTSTPNLRDNAQEHTQQPQSTSNTSDGKMVISYSKYLLVNVNV